MSKTLALAAYGAVIFLVSLVFLFPVETLVRNQVAAVEQRTGLSIVWNGDRWALWHSALHHVIVSDSSGHRLVELDTLDIHPTGTTIQMDGRAAWGELRAWLRAGEIEVNLSGYPLGTMDKVPLQDGRLGAQMHYQPAGGSLNGSFNVSGQAKLPVGYDGPVTLEGLIHFQGTAGQLSLEVHGDRLRATGNMDIACASGSLGDMTVSGPLNVELNGSKIRLAAMGSRGAFTITPTL